MMMDSLNTISPATVVIPRPLVVALILVAICTGTVHGQQGRKEVIGYFLPSKWTSTKSSSLERIAYDKLTMINYAFFYPLPDGRIVGRDTSADAWLLRGAPGTTLPDIAHKHGVKVLLSLGGWDESDNFPAMAARPESRTTFARSCAEAVREYRLDGIDIDWEYPGYADHRGTPEDTRNFTLLLREIRQSLERYGKESGRRYLLTAALPAGRSHAARIEMTPVSEILDQLNIMTYDFYGSWDKLAYHNSPLYASEGGDSAQTVDGAFRLYHDLYGVPAEKINLGIPFYGHTFTGCTALNTPHGSPDTVHFPPPTGATYGALRGVAERFTRRWDRDARVPYFVSTDWNVLVSIEDEQSVREKAQYIVERGARGAIIWEITGDVLPDGTTPLLDAIVSVFQSSTTDTH